MGGLSLKLLVYITLIEIARFFVLVNIVTLIILGICSYKYPNYFINKYFILGSILGGILGSILSEISRKEYMDIVLFIFFNGFNMLFFFFVWCYVGFLWYKAYKKQQQNNKVVNRKSFFMGVSLFSIVLLVSRWYMLHIV